MPSESMHGRNRWDTTQCARIPCNPSDNGSVTSSTTSRCASIWAAAAAADRREGAWQLHSAAGEERRFARFLTTDRRVSARQTDTPTDRRRSRNRITAQTRQTESDLRADRLTHSRAETYRQRHDRSYWCQILFSLSIIRWWKHRDKDKDNDGVRVKNSGSTTRRGETKSEAKTTWHVHTLCVW